VLLQTPLLGADNKVYAVAQGSLLIGGFSVGGGEGSTLTTNHPTVARLPGGAIMERSIQSDIVEDGTFYFLLNHPDHAAAALMEEKINQYFPGSAKAVSAQNLKVEIPETYSDSVTTFIASVEALNVETDTTARVVMDERTGTIVVTSDVQLSAVSVSHGNVTVSVARTPFVSQPGAFSGGTTVIGQVTDIEVLEVEGGFSQLGDAPTLSDLTQALNSLGVSPREMMTILQSVERAGALHAELLIE